MLWPTRPDVWRESAQPAQRAFVEIASAIARFEPLTVGVVLEHYAQARACLPASVRVVELSYDDIWVRDSGPSFVINSAGQVRGVDWGFNAWGGLYADWLQDAALAQKILEMESADRYLADFVLEGGSIHVDGQGTLLTTRECLLNPNRNPHLTEADIEARLQAYLNVEKIIWLDWGVYNDETSGHIDNLACFVRPGVVALTWTDDLSDPQYERSRLAWEQLNNATDAQGCRLEIHRIHQPGPLYMTEAEAAGILPMAGSHARLEGNRLAGSYINFYIANGGVVVPQFDDPHDLPALRQIAELFPGRQVVGVPGREILLGGGNIHCITQQQPLPQANG
jgi:agmatine deiminase